MGKRLVLVLVVALLLSACACRSAKEPFLAEWDLIVEEWDDQLEVAGSTSRIALPSVIQGLQATKRKMGSIPTEECEELDALQRRTVLYMESTIQGFVLFMANEGTEDYVERAVTAKFKVARSYFDDAVALRVAFDE